MQQATRTTSPSTLRRVVASPWLMSVDRPGLQLVIATAWVLIGVWAVTDGQLVLGLVWVGVGVGAGATLAARRLMARADSHAAQQRQAD